MQAPIAGKSTQVGLERARQAGLGMNDKAELGFKGQSGWDMHSGLGRPV
jgi:hypothetical protein